MEKKTLVIAEKIKAAKALMRGLNENFTFHQAGPKMNRCQAGYYESDTKIITYARGHLFRLFTIEEYLGFPKDSPRRFDVLPYVPTDFKISVSEDDQNFCAIQFNTIKELIHRNDVNKIVNFGDPDSEGELLIREILSEAKNTKPVERLWCNQMVDEVVVDAFYNLKKDSDSVGYYYKAKARQETDWLLGMNLSRYLKIKTGLYLPVGRVLIPIVKYIYDRDKAIADFNSTCSYGINAVISKDKCNKTISSSTPEIYFEEKNKNVCKLLSDSLNKKEKTVCDVKNTNKELRPNKLFDLTSFRSQMNIHHKYSVNESTAVAQSLYESGFISYPRTSSQYLSDQSKPTIKAIISKLNTRGMNLVFKDSNSVFDNAKTSSEGHTALVITTKIPTTRELSSMNEKERNGYFLIFNRTVSNFCEMPLIKETVVQIRVDKYIFKLTGHTLIREGFLKYETRLLNATLPDFIVGENVDMIFKTAKRDTRPPKKVSVTELGLYLKFPYSDVLKKMDKNNDAFLYQMLKEGASIGTEATIPAIISNAINYGYITSSTTTYSITEKGIALMNILDELQINLYRERNIEMNKKITAVSKKDFTLQENKFSVKNELENIFEYGKTVDINTNYSNNEEVGKCPNCGKPVCVFNGKKGKIYSCIGNKADCGFVLYENDNFFAAFKRKINKTTAKSLINFGSVELKDLISKNNKKYNIKINASFENGKIKYTTEFSKKKGA